MRGEGTLRTAGVVVAVAICAVAAPRAWDTYRDVRLHRALARLDDVAASELRASRSRLSSASAPRARRMRGAVQASSLRLRGAVADVLVRAQERQQHLDARRAVALASHYDGDYGVATKELERIALATGAAADWSDLAAARLDAAVATKSPATLVGALVAANRALEKDARFAPALYNRAAVIEALGLREHARAAWQRCLAAETDAAWHGEIQEHLGELPHSDDERWAVARSRLPDASPADVRKICERFPQQARVHAESVLPTQWAAAVLSRDSTGAARHLRLARVVSEAVNENTGDRFTVDAVEVIERTVASNDVQRIEKLARAYRVYHEGRILNRDHDVARAEAKLREAAAEFASLRSPMQLVALHFAVLTLVEQNRGGEAAAAYDALARDARGYRALSAEIAWPIAYQHGVSGRWDAALAAAARAVSGFRALGEKESTGSMEGMLAEMHDFLGQPARAWQHHVVAFSLLSDAGDPYRLQVALAGASRPYIRQQKWEEALALLDLEIERSDFPENVNLRADAMARRARVRAARGDRGAARTDLALGRAAAAQIEDPAGRAKLIADLDAAGGIVERYDDPRLSVQLLTNAISFYETADRTLLLPELFLERGRSHLANRSDDSALADFEAGLDRLEEQRATVSEFESAGTFSDPAADLFIEAVRVAVRRGDAGRAFAYSERSRARALSRLTSNRVRSVPPLPGGTVAVEYMVLPEQLVIFTVARKVRMTTTPIRATDLEALVERLTATIVEPSSTIRDVQQASAAVRRAVLDPVADDIRNASTVVFVAHQFLERVPWAALYDTREQRYLTEQTLPLTEPSLAFVANRERPAARRPPTSALVVGNPRSASPLFDTLPSLASAETEARKIAAVYAKPNLLLGSAATRDRVLQQVTRFDALHFAGHAVTSAKNDDESFLVLASDEAAGTSALLHSRDIARLDLDGTQLVVLAACGTLRGTTVHLDGMPSIARSFLAAGASAVIATLWDIEDVRAASLFSRIHQRVTEGTPVGDALREVQLQAIRSTNADVAHPKTWAGITLVGGFDP